MKTLRPQAHTLPRRWKCPVLLLAILGLAAAPAVAETCAPLAQAISIKEIRIDRGREEAPLAFGSIAQDVDINSLVEIEIDSGKLGDALICGRDSVELKRELDALQDLLRSFEEILPLLDRALRQATYLVNKAARGPLDAELVLDQERLLREIAVPIAAYSAVLEESPDEQLRQHFAEFDEGLRQATILATTTEENSSYVILVADETRWLDEQIQRIAAEIEKTLRGVALVLVARSVVGSGEPQRVHLPHYDPLQPGAIVPYEKVNWAADSETARRMLAIVKAPAAALEDLRTGKIELREALQPLLKAGGIDTGPLAAGLGEFAGAAGELRDTDWGGALDGLVNDLGRALADDALGAEEREKLDAVAERAREIRDGILSVEQRIADIREELEIPSLRWFADEVHSQPDEIGALDVLVRGVSRAWGAPRRIQQTLSSIQTTFSEIGRSIEGAARLSEELLSGMRDLPQRTRDVLRAETERFAWDRLARLSGAAESVRAEAKALARTIQDMGDDRRRQLDVYLAADFPVPADVFFVLGSEIKNTRLDLRTVAGRHENDAVLLDARLYELKSESPAGAGPADRALIGAEIDKEVQWFRMLRFGWYSVPNVSVAYVSSEEPLEGQSDKAKQFVPQASWLLKRRPWIADSSSETPAIHRPRWYSSIGYGLHTVVLDMNKDNEQEVGAGLTISLFRDFLQLGYGFNLTLDEQRYWFVGLKVFEFKNLAGTATAPADGGPEPGAAD